MNAECNRLTESLEELTYLETLNEDLIYREYRPALAKDNSNPFADFSQEHRDAFYRMKFREMNSRLSQGQPISRPPL
jgi:hypothetical protein